MLAAADDLALQLRGLGLAELLRLRLTRAIAVASPAAGSDWSASPPSGTVWELLAVGYSLTTSAVVANRSSHLRLDDGNGTRALLIAATAVQAASLTVAYQWAAGAGPLAPADGQYQSLPSPPLVVPSGYTLRSVTSLIDAGDTYTGVELLVREWSVAEVAAQADWIAQRAC